MSSASLRELFEASLRPEGRDPKTLRGEALMSNVRWVTIVLVFCGWPVLAGCGLLDADPLGEAGQVVTVVGTVRELDSSEMAVDGPGRIELRSDRHGRVAVFIQSCMGPCALEAVEAFLQQMEEGERWQVTGEVTPEGDLSLYDDNLHGLTPLTDG